MNTLLSDVDLQARKTSAIAEGVLKQISQAARDAWEASKGGSLVMGQAPGASQAAASGRIVSEELTARLQSARQAAASAGKDLTALEIRAVAHRAWTDVANGLRVALADDRPAVERPRG